jgi:hypothetical protein
MATMRATPPGHEAAPVPAVARFVWLGGPLPWLFASAIESARARGGFAEVVVHHDGSLEASPAWRELAGRAGLSCEPLDVAALCEEAGRDPAPLVDLLGGLRAASARANVLRVLLLAARGGVYLDTDTITLRPFDALRARGGVFCGREHVVFPATTVRSRDPRTRGKAWALSMFRGLCTVLPRGHRLFRRFEAWYPQAVNNAVLGGPAGHPFWTEMLDRMLALPRERRRVRYALGTHLLQDAVAGFAGPDLHVESPEVFYPVGPGLAARWFHPHTGGLLDDVVTPRTVLVHWYASGTRKVGKIGAAYVARHAQSRAICKLTAPFVVAAAP